MSPEVQEKIVQAMQAGTPYIHAARGVGVKDVTARNWLLQAQGRLGKGKPTRRLQDFLAETESALSRAVTGLVTINTAVAKGGHVVKHRTTTKTVTKPSGEITTTVEEEKIVTPPNAPAAQWALERLDRDAFGQAPPQVNVNVGVALREEFERAIALPIVDPRRRIEMEQENQAASALPMGDF